MIIRFLIRLVRYLANKDRLIDFNDGTWEIERGQMYRYEVFIGSRSIDGSKTFKYKGGGILLCFIRLHTHTYPLCFFSFFLILGLNNLAR